MGASYTGHNLLFVVGAPRSGTTWVQRLLASHHGIRTGQESKLFSSYISPQLRAWRWEIERERDGRAATGRGGTGLSCYLTEDEFLKVLRQYTTDLLEAMTGPLRPGEWFLEKTPGHARFLEDIHLVLPDARVVHMLRDGRDVTASLLAASRSWGSAWAPRSGRRAAATWVQHVRAARQAARVWPAAQFREVTYEELSADTPGVLRRLAGFLGLDWSDDAIADAVGANTADELRCGRGTAIPLKGRLSAGERVSEPLEFVRRAVVGGWRRDLSWVQKLAVEWVAGDLLRELEYIAPSRRDRTGRERVGAVPPPAAHSVHASGATSSSARAAG